MSHSISVCTNRLQAAVPCDLCDTGAAGQHYCKVCKQTLCGACKKIHEKVPSLKNHPIVSRSEITSALTDLMSCPKHTSEYLYKHCLNCKLDVCMMCVSGDHIGHQMSELKTKSAEEEEQDSRKELESSSEFEDTVVRSAVADERSVIQTTEIAIQEAFQCKCQKHVTQKASFHCEKCNVHVCTKCITGKHRGHPMEEIETKFEQRKAELEKELADMEGNILPRCTKDANDLRGRRDSYKKTVANIRKEMEEEVQTLKFEIDRSQNERNQKLDAKETNDLNVFLMQEKKLESLKSAVGNEISKCKNQLHACRRNPADFLNFAGRRKRIPNDVPDAVSVDTPHFTRMSEKSVSQILGKLDLSQSSTKKALKPCSPQVVSTFNAGMGSSPTLCLTKNGLAWIGSRDSTELRLINFSIEVPERKKLETRLFALAIMENGNIVLSPHCEDSRFVVILKTDGTEEFIFDASPSYTEGLSITSDQHILVCTADGRLVKCDTETKDVKEIYRASSTLYQAIELPDKTICITDWGSRHLLIIDQEGNNIAKISKPLGRAKFLPRGVVCDRMGNILFSDQKNDCVYIMDAGRHVKELVGASHGIRSPDWLVLDKDDNLLVTNDEGKVTVVKYLAPVPV